MLEKARWLLSNARLDKSFWAEGIVYASHLINGLSSTAIGGKTLLRVWSEKAAQGHGLLREFGSPTYFSAKDGKVNLRAKKFLFLYVKRNLISVGALETLGLMVFIRYSVLKITKGSMVIMNGVRRRNLYYLKGNTVTGQIETSISSDDGYMQV